MKNRREILVAAAIAAMMVGAAGCSTDTSSAGSNEVASSPTAAGSGGQQMGAAERVGKALDVTGQDVKANLHDAAAKSDAAAHRAALKTRMGAQRAGHDVKEAGSSAAVAADTAALSASRDVQMMSAPLVITPKVKMALIGDARIDASKINVDTDASARQVVLKGTVTTADKKSIAGQIATQELAKMHSSYSLRNDLEVSGS